jgi:hypothetical protein
MERWFSACRPIERAKAKQRHARAQPSVGASTIATRSHRENAEKRGPFPIS